MAQQSTMDICPWPNGEGFQGADNWWDYVRNHTEPERLDFLLMAALTNEEIRHLLLAHDATLFTKFDLSRDTIDLLSRIQVNSLEAFAQALTLNVDGFT